MAREEKNKWIGIAKKIKIFFNIFEVNYVG